MCGTLRLSGGGLYGDKLCLYYSFDDSTPFSFPCIEGSVQPFREGRVQDFSQFLAGTSISLQLKLSISLYLKCSVSLQLKFCESIQLKCTTAVALYIEGEMQSLTGPVVCTIV